ncbi:MAG TPA: hypothetical protein VFB04_08335, partial [Terriglobales bacterium]|nr:hypothetical protein [Terriglobales bacterium]
MRLLYQLLISLLLLTSWLPARADIGLLLDAKPNVQVELGNALTGAGHSGVYLSNVCTVTPVQLRLCRPGELGTVIQNYENFEENAPFAWNAVPLGVYLYGVDDPAQRPLFGSPELRLALQEQYRRKYLEPICSTERCINDPRANWRDSVAAAFVREIYIFEVATAPEQDEQFVRDFNARANVNHYSGFANNCADFAKLVANIYFPHSAHRNILNDLGMTTPKAIARSFTHYAEHHPELDLRVVRVEQLPGTYKRSSDTREGTEQLFRAKKLLVPIAVFGYQAVPVFAASYFLTGRFSPDHELRKHPSDEAASLTQDLNEAKHAGDKAQRRQLENELKQERERQVGDEEQWLTLRRRFNEVLQTAIADGVVSDRRRLRELFRELQAQGRVYLDANQQAWMEVENQGELRRVGLTAATIVSPESDRRLALQLLLARMDYLLYTGSQHRELYPDVEADWQLLQRAEQVAAAPVT